MILGTIWLQQNNTLLQALTVYQHSETEINSDTSEHRIKKDLFKFEQLPQQHNDFRPSMKRFDSNAIITRNIPFNIILSNNEP